MQNLVQDAIICNCVKRLLVGYRTLYRNSPLNHLDLVNSIAHLTLRQIATSDAPYHNVEHTVLVTLTGQAILQGKLMQEGNVSSEDWLHMILALLCHDIGYVKGVCHQDKLEDRLFTIGKDGEQLYLTSSTTDASLTPYHIDRSQCFVRETLRQYPTLEIERINHYIELTRFPVPSDPCYQDTIDYPGLVRAADLIGQLADPNYLQKTTALFQEFEEVGITQQLGYDSPEDVRFAYPDFFWNGVYPYIQTGLQYLEMTPEGRRMIHYLYQNLFKAEAERRSLKLPRLKALNQTRSALNKSLVLS